MTFPHVYTALKRFKTKRLLTISNLEHSRLINCTRQLHLGVLCIYKWAQERLEWRRNKFNSSLRGWSFFHCTAKSILTYQKEKKCREQGFMLQKYGVNVYQTSYEKVQRFLQIFAPWTELFSKTKCPWAELLNEKFSGSAGRGECNGSNWHLHQLHETEH